MLMLVEKGLTPEPEAEAHLKKYLSFIYELRDKYFGNARTVRSIVEEAVKNQNLRLAALSVEERAMQSSTLLTLEDVAHLRLDKKDLIFERQRIGFRRSEPAADQDVKGLPNAPAAKASKAKEPKSNEPGREAPA
jgi:hypothetical protein